MTVRSDYNHSIPLYRQIIKLCLKERLLSQVGEQYWVLAKLYSAIGDRRKATHYTRVAYKEFGIYAKAGAEVDEKLKEIENTLPLSVLRTSDRNLRSDRLQM